MKYTVCSFDKYKWVSIGLAINRQMVKTITVKRRKIDKRELKL